jgi:hypothetical protein
MYGEGMRALKIYWLYGKKLDSERRIKYTSISNRDSRLLIFIHKIHHWNSLNFTNNIWLWL